MDFYVANHLVNLIDFWTSISAERMRNVHYIISLSEIKCKNA